MDKENDFIFSLKSPGEAKLGSFILSYGHFYDQSGHHRQKQILPSNNVSLIFNFKAAKINGQVCPDIMLVGLHENVYLMTPAQREIETVIIQFSSFGFARFSDTPVSEITETFVNAERVFGDSIRDLFNQMRSTGDFEIRNQLLDSFFCRAIRNENHYFLYVSKLAGILQKYPGPTVAYRNDFDLYPLSSRHMARVFKDQIGVNAQTFRRLSRFVVAKNLLYQPKPYSLAAIGYASGYYDPAHFSREFKKLSGHNAKNSDPICPL